MKKTKRLKSADLSSFCSQLSLLINAGITPLESLKILSKDTSDARIQDLLSDIAQNSADCQSFSEALAKTSVFPDYFINMLSLGEESGNMDEVLQNLSAYYEHESSITDSIQSALRYPIIMLIMMAVVLSVLLTKVLPIFQQVFIQLGSELTGLAKRFMLIGNILNDLSIGILIFILFAFLFGIFLLKNAKGNQMLHSFLTYSPLTRSFYLNIAYARFANGLSMALSSGLDTFRSLDLVANLITNKIMLEKISLCKASLQQDASFPEALKQSEIFSNLYLQMLTIGFRTGNVDSVLKNISKHYDREIELKLHSMLSALEPTLVIIFSSIVGLILLSVIMPLIGIMSSIS